MPEHKPDIYFNQDGICNFCVDFQRENAQGKNNLLESEFIEKISKYRGKGKYDCLVMCSGGKDSTAALYYMKKKYKFTPLAFTFDHGFENEEALDVIKNATDVLGVDWLYFKTESAKDLFAEIIKIKSKAPICSICSLWYFQVVYDIANRLGISLIIGGWTKGQMIKGDKLLHSNVAFPTLTKATVDFVEGHLRKIPKYKNFPKNMDELIRKVPKSNRSIFLSPHWFLPVDEEEYVELIKKELQWKTPKLSYPKNSTNCLLNYISVWLSMKHFGFSHYHIEMSKLIREDQMTKEEAIKKLEIDFNLEFLSPIAKKLDCNPDDL